MIIDGHIRNSPCSFLWPRFENLRPVFVEFVLWRKYEVDCILQENQSMVPGVLRHFHRQMDAFYSTMRVNGTAIRGTKFCQVKIRDCTPWKIDGKSSFLKIDVAHHRVLAAPWNFGIWAFWSLSFQNHSKNRGLMICWPLARKLTMPHTVYSQFCL